MKRTQAYLFGPFRLDTHARLLFCNGDVVPLTPKVVDTLVALVEKQGKVVEKEELLRAVWPDTFVEESNLTQNVSVLRKTLRSVLTGEAIETIPKRGYRFIATVTEERLPSIQAAGQEIRSLAVLPFVNLSPDPANEYFSDGLTEELIHLLFRIENLQVVGRSSVFRFKGKPMDIREVGRRLNADALLEGSVQKEGRALRVTAELSDVDSGYLLWAESYERDVQDLLDIQEEIARAIVEKLKIQLSGGSDHLLVTSTQVSEAYEFYLKGRYYWGRLRDDDAFQNSIECFEKAIRSDPSYSLPYVGLADAYWRAAVRGVAEPKRVFPKAAEAVNKALLLDGDLAPAYKAQAIIKMKYEWDWSGAEQAFLRALELDPHCTIALHWYSHYLMAKGRGEESLAASKRALELDPLDITLNLHLGWHYYFARHFEESIAQVEKTLDSDPGYCIAYVDLGKAYVQKRMYKEALAALEKAMRLLGGGSEKYAWLIHAYAQLGREAKALIALEQLKELSRERYVSSYDLAIAYVGLGDREKALTSLQAAYDERASSFPYLGVEPAFDPLHSDRRFSDLLKGMGLK